MDQVDSIPRRNFTLPTTLPYSSTYGNLLLLEARLRAAWLRKQISPQARLFILSLSNPS